MSRVVIFVDVDDTLVRSFGQSRIPMPNVIEAVRAWHAQGAVLYCWSTGGAEYARSSAGELGIGDCFNDYLPKPTMYVDDQEVADWRLCRHLLPANASPTSLLSETG